MGGGGAPHRGRLRRRQTFDICTRSIAIRRAADPWQDLWSDPQGDGEILGGVAVRQALEAHWRSFFHADAFSAQDLILDVGAGAAPIARAAAFLAPERRPAFVCVDYAPAALVAASRALRDASGAALLGVAGDARALPFMPGRFAAVVSQFGLEYAGNEAFVVAAAQVRPGGVLESIVHAAGGGIHEECNENARVVGIALDSGLIRRLTETLKASYAEAPAGGSSVYINKKKEAQFGKALDDLRTRLAASPQSGATVLIRRYAADMERLASRRFAFAPEDALGWVAQIDRRLSAYRARMNAMRAAARREEDMASIVGRLAAGGLPGAAFEPLRLIAGGPIGAWRLSAEMVGGFSSRRHERGESAQPAPAGGAAPGPGARRDASDLIAAGNAAYAAGRFVEAAELGRKAIAADPANPWAHNLLGAACAEEMEHDDSRRAFAAAVAADPGIAISHVNLAYALILAGDFVEAEAHLRTALDIEPAAGGAFLNLAWIHKATAGDPLIARLEDLRRQSGNDAQARSLYNFALGKCYDDVGAYDLAFACFRQGNELSGVAFEDAAWRDHLARIRTVFDRPFIAARAGAGFASEKPVFIVGMPRCGSSLLEDRLARHPRIASLGERPEIGRIVSRLGADPPYTPYPEGAGAISPGALAALGKSYVQKFEARHQAAARLIDKNLLNHRFLGLIRTMLPGAAVIHCRRDPLDTCLSCYFQRLRPDHSYKFSLAALGAYYRNYVDLMAHWDEALGDIVVADYESFVEAPDAEYARVLAALRLDPALLSAEAPTRHIQTSSAFQVRQPVTKSSIGRWRNYQKHLGPLIEALGPLART